MECIAKQIPIALFRGDVDHNNLTAGFQLRITGCRLTSLPAIRKVLALSHIAEEPWKTASVYQIRR